ncbi:hypothetical protein C4K68_00875 [Pokkaliibacter plantistimulans]|uniref:Uncharacterized protein n=1 Tax=Proteobacteria bacterium 228 TaxID=2083153 RepID=A0A2S5KWZ0_9PROT|nr:hypothetical protein C4K68_00875 [Pokkaliibacter plantistimulans]
MPNTASKTGSKCSLSSLNSAVSPVACALGVFPCLGCLDNVFQQPVSYRSQPYRPACWPLHESRQSSPAAVHPA